MHRTTIPTLMLVLIAAAPGVLGANHWIARGQYIAGDPIAYLVLDACGDPAQESIDSNCFALPANAGNKHYTLYATDSMGTVIDASACYYTADFMMVQCDPWNARVPVWASYAGISSLGGVSVSWTYVLQN